MRIAILGAAGKLGRLTTDHLRQRDPAAELILTSRSPRPGQPEWLTFDPFTDDWAGLGKVDVLVNCIGIIDDRAMSFEAVHIGIVERMLAAQAQLGHPRIVHMSALGADPAHPVDFLRTKGHADEQLLAARPDSVVVRPSIVCTPGTMVAVKLRKLLRSGKLTLGKVFVPQGFPETHIQPVMPEDLGALMAEAVLGAERRGIVVAVGPEPVPFRTVLEWMQENSPRRMRLVELPKSFLDGFVRHFLSVWFPSTINYDQFQLLFMDNIGNGERMESWIGREVRSSQGFWVTEGTGDRENAPEEPAGAVAQVHEIQ